MLLVSNKAKVNTVLRKMLPVAEVDVEKNVLVPAPHNALLHYGLRWHITAALVLFMIT